jgi:alcohol dehydrogenase YqhD (iron-dependent ADH family)
MYDEMANFILTGYPMGLNGFFKYGVKQDWATHNDSTLNHRIARINHE